MASHPMSTEEIRAFLGDGPARTAKLATVRADGRPHVVPVWFALDTSAADQASPVGDLVFNTGSDSVKGANLLRDARVALCFDDERPPFSFVTIDGVVQPAPAPRFSRTPSRIRAQESLTLAQAVEAWSKPRQID